MALQQDLIDALHNLTTAIGQDRQDARNQATQPLNALGQLANNAAAGQNPLYIEWP